MGIHIFLQDRNGEDHKDWDFLRQGLDNDFLSKILHNDKIESDEKVNKPYDDVDMWRPKNITKMRDLIDKWEVGDYSKERYYHFCDILRDNEYIFIYISY